MQKWLRRIRGAIGMGVIWGVVWGAVGSVPRWVFGINADVPFPLVFGVFGFASGVTFSGLLLLTEGRRGFDQLTLPRAAGWGAIGGLMVSSLFAKIVSLGWGDALAIAPIFAVASAVCASGSLALARRATRRELSVGHPDAPEARVTDQEIRTLR